MKRLTDKFCSISGISYSSNPFKPSTTIVFMLGKKSSLFILHMDGEIVRVLGQFAPDTHKITWNGNLADDRKAPTGNYVVAIKEGDGLISNLKITLIK